MVLQGSLPYVKMDDVDTEMTISSTKSSVDSGFDGFLSDSSTSSTSSKSDSCWSPDLAICAFEEPAAGERHAHHRCALSVYKVSGHGIETFSSRTFLYLANCVRVLDLSRNNINMVPETVSELQNLQELNLSFNELKSLPDSCVRLRKLQVLNLSQNKFSEPPSCFERGMDRITHLDLSANHISQFSNPPKCSLFLESLNISHNCFNLLPLWLFSDQCRSLTELDVSFNFCFDDPSLQKQILLLKHHRTSMLKSLKKLKICNTGIKSGLIVPLNSFQSLQSVHLGNLKGPETTQNYFSEVDMNLFCKCENIVELHLTNVGLAGLPEEIQRFRNLEVLDASHNQLDWLPETFGLLKSLRELILSDCNLSYLPENFSMLRRLKKLVLDRNQLTDVRSSVDSLPCLEWLDVYSNHLEVLPVSPEHLRNLHMVDLAYNCVNLEKALDVEVNGENLLDVYSWQQARLREVTAADEARCDGPRATLLRQSWDSLESYRHRSGSFSDLSQSEGNSSYQYCFNVAEDDPEEDWDEESANECDEFEPDSVYRYHLPPGLYQFGWVPPTRRRPCPVPIGQQASGFVFVPGQWHQRTTVRKLRRRVSDLAVEEGQFADAHVGDFAGLQKAESLGAMLREKLMFVRNPAGLRTRRRCRFHSVYEDCLHHGIWFRLNPPACFDIPAQPDDQDDI